MEGGRSKYSEDSKRQNNLFALHAEISMGKGKRQITYCTVFIRLSTLGSY